MTQPVGEGSATRLAMLGNLDLCGVMRGRSVPIERAEEAVSAGLPWVPTNIMLSPFSTIPSGNPFGPMGEVRLVADPGMKMILPAVGERPALELYLCDLMDTDGEPWPVCPRQQLKAAIARLRDETGLTVRAGFEHECYIYGVQDMATPAFSLAGTRAISGLAEAVQASVASAGARLEQCVAEFGEHQFEVSGQTRDALRAADEAVLAREAVRDAARIRGWHATFAPKPKSDQPGSGVHIHLSLWNADGRPVTAERDALTAMSGSFVSGVLREMMGIMAFTTPTPNSFERIRPSHWVGVYTCFGVRNREAAIRLCPRPAADDGGNPAASIEFRVADGGCNPYLALAALLHAGVDGIQDGLAEPQNVDGDPATFSQAERAEHSIEPVADSIQEVIEAYQASEFARRTFGTKFHQAYLAVLENAVIDAKALGDDYARRYTHAV